MTRIMNALRRLWNIATCEHRGAAHWDVLLPDLETGAGFVEMHFCRACGRLMNGIREGDQPQHNTHWLERDQMDARVQRHFVNPHTPELRVLANRFRAEEV